MANNALVRAPQNPFEINAAAKKLGIIMDGTNSRPNLATCVRAFDFEATVPAVGDGRTLEGYAAVFNRVARIADWGGDFDEMLMPGAFRKSLAKRKPVMQYDHGRDTRVGSVPIASIEDIHEDSNGLYVRARLFDNPVIEPVRQAIAGEAIKGMSFRFTVPAGGDTWTVRKNDVDLREITEADTRECGPVVFPAYDATSVSVRSMLATLSPEERNALIRELAEQVQNFTDLDARSTDDGDETAESGNEEAVATPTYSASARNRMLALRSRGIDRV